MLRSHLPCRGSAPCRDPALDPWMPTRRGAVFGNHSPLLAEWEEVPLTGVDWCKPQDYISRRTSRARAILRNSAPQRHRSHRAGRDYSVSIVGHLMRWAAGHCHVLGRGRPPAVHGGTGGRLVPVREHRGHLDGKSLMGQSAGGGGLVTQRLAFAAWALGDLPIGVRVSQAARGTAVARSRTGARHSSCRERVGPGAFLAPGRPLSPRTGGEPCQFEGCGRCEHER